MSIIANMPKVRVCDINEELKAPRKPFINKAADSANIHPSSAKVPTDGYTDKQKNEEEIEDTQSEVTEGGGSRASKQDRREAAAIERVKRFAEKEGEHVTSAKAKSDTYRKNEWKDTHLNRMRAENGGDYDARTSNRIKVSADTDSGKKITSTYERGNGKSTYISDQNYRVDRKNKGSENLEPRHYVRKGNVYGELDKELKDPKWRESAEHTKKFLKDKKEQGNSLVGTIDNNRRKYVSVDTGRHKGEVRKGSDSWIFGKREEAASRLMDSFGLEEEEASMILSLINEDEDDDSIVEILRDHYQDESNDSAEYTKLATVYPQFAKYFEEMAADEAKHAQFCKEMMQSAIEMSE